MLSNLVGTMRARGVRGWRVTEGTGIGETQLSRFINGHQELGSVQRQQLAEFLGADPRWLFSHEFSVPPLPELAVAAAVSTGDRGG